MNIEIRHCDDWIAVYRDGNKVYENHSCSIRDGLDALEIPYHNADLYEKVDYDGYFSNGESAFPEKLP